MIIAIIPTHNQQKHIENIIRSYEKQTLRPDLLLFVLDRCSDNSEYILKNISSDLNVSYTIKDCGENFSAGMTRDFGVDKILESEEYKNYDMILFTDGDCYPNETVVEDHWYNCSLRKEPIVSCGMRLKQNEKGEYQDDERNGRWAEGQTFVNRNGRVIISRALSLDNILTYSCNLAFNHSAIDLCKNINLQLSGIERVFNPEFDGEWGGEDNFISDCLFRTGNWITLTDKRSFVKHDWHPESFRNMNRITLWKSLSERLSSFIINGIIKGPVSHIEKCRFYSHPLFLGGPINNIKNVLSCDFKYSDVAEVFFYSRNIEYHNTDIEVRMSRRKEEELFKLYEISAFRKMYLTPTDIIEDSNLDEYEFCRCDKQSPYLQ